MTSSINGHAAASPACRPFLPIFMKMNATVVVNNIAATESYCQTLHGYYVSSLRRDNAIDPTGLVSHGGTWRWFCRRLWHGSEDRADSFPFPQFTFSNISVMSPGLPFFEHSEKRQRISNKSHITMRSSLLRGANKQKNSEAVISPHQRYPAQHSHSTGKRK